MAGIYRIVVSRPGLPDKFYVGHASILRKRRDKHFSELKRGIHKTRPLQEAFVEYGIEAFQFEVLLVCERKPDILELYEQAVVDSYHHNRLYNLNLACVGSALGRTMSAKTKAAIGAGNRGKVRTPEHIEAVRKAHIGRVHSPEELAKRSASMTGKKFPGRTLSIDRKVKVGDFFRGRKKSSEEIARRVATRKAKGWFSPKASERVVQSNKNRAGQKASAETSIANVCSAHTKARDQCQQ